MLAGVFSVVFLLALWGLAALVRSVVCLLALRGLAALVRAAALCEHWAFMMGRMRLRAGFVFAGVCAI